MTARSVDRIDPTAADGGLRLGRIRVADGRGMTAMLAGHVAAQERLAAAITGSADPATPDGVAPLETTLRWRILESLRQRDAIARVDFRREIHAIMAIPPGEWISQSRIRVQLLRIGIRQACHVIGIHPDADRTSLARWSLTLSSAALRLAAAHPMRGDGTRDEAGDLLRDRALAASALLGRSVVIECGTPAMAGLPAMPAVLVGGSREDAARIAPALRDLPNHVDVLLGSVTTVTRRRAFGDADVDPLAAMRALAALAV